MSQTAVFIHVDNSLHQEIFPSMPDHEGAVQICKDFGYTPEDAAYEGDDICVECEWFEIGKGEAGTDNIFSDQELLAKYQNGNFEEQLEKDGYSIESVMEDAFTVYYEELTED